MSVRWWEGIILVGLPHKILGVAEAPGVRAGNNIIERACPRPFLLEVVELEHAVWSDPIVISEPLSQGIQELIPTAMAG